MRAYDPKFRELDEQLIRLITERFRMGGDREGGMPDQEQIQAWSEAFDLEVFYLHRFFNLFAAPQGRPFAGPKHLRTVLPVLRKVEQDGVLYELTHMMQYENSSVVFLTIDSADPHSSVQFGMPELILDITPSGYHVTPSGSRGGGNHFEMSFIVTPPLPDDMSEMHLKLVPHVRFNGRLDAKILNERVDF